MKGVDPAERDASPQEWLLEGMLSEAPLVRRAWWTRERREWLLEEMSSESGLSTDSHTYGSWKRVLKGMSSEATAARRDEELETGTGRNVE